MEKIIEFDSIYYKEKKITSYPIAELQKELIVIFDEPLATNSCVAELKRFTAKIGLSSAERESRLEKFVKFFAMESYINKPLSELTRQELYMIKILRYLIIDPVFIAIDNILSCTGSENSKRIFEYIKKHEMTLLNITTNLDEALYGNKLFVLENFVLILEGNTLSVLKTDTLLKRLGFSLPLPVDLSIELIHYDVLDKIYTTNESLVNALWK